VAVAKRLGAVVDVGEVVEGDGDHRVDGAVELLADRQRSLVQGDGLRIVAHVVVDLGEEVLGVGAARGGLVAGVEDGEREVDVA
jgi:hypothetical protein